jgi:hypothetical protein
VLCASLAQTEASVASNDVPIEAGHRLLDPAPPAAFRGCCRSEHRVALAVDAAPDLVPLQFARLAVRGAALRRSDVSVKCGWRLGLVAGSAELVAGLTIEKNQTLYKSFVCMHLCVLRRGLSSKRAVGEPPRTRTENRLIKSSLANEAKDSCVFGSSLV